LFLTDYKSEFFAFAINYNDKNINLLFFIVDVKQEIEIKNNQFLGTNHNNKNNLSKSGIL